MHSEFDSDLVTDHFDSPPVLHNLVIKGFMSNSDCATGHKNDHLSLIVKE